MEPAIKNTIHEIKLSYFLCLSMFACVTSLRPLNWHELSKHPFQSLGALRFIDSKQSRKVAKHKYFASMVKVMKFLVVCAKDETTR